MGWTEIKDVLLTIGMVIGPVWAYLASRAREVRLLEERRLEAEEKRLEAKSKSDDSTGAQVLEAWKVTLGQVRDERAALAIEAERSKQAREDAETARDEAEEARKQARLEHEAAESARRQSQLDNELAEIATRRNHDCQESLEEMSEQLAEMMEQIKEHSQCPGKIKKLETDIKLLRYQLGLSDIPPPL